MNLTYKPKLETRDASVIREYFFCERMHAKIPKATCFARQFALVQGSRRFLFPECWTCPQGKIIAKERLGPIGGKKDEPVMKASAEKSEGVQKANKPPVAEKRNQTSNPQPLPDALPRNEMAVVQVDFRGYPQIFEGIQKMAEEEIRPVELQIIYLLKSYLERQN